MKLDLQRCEYCGQLYTNGNPRCDCVKKNTSNYLRGRARKNKKNERQRRGN